MRGLHLGECRMLSIGSFSRPLLSASTEVFAATGWLIAAISSRVRVRKVTPM